MSEIDKQSLYGDFRDDMKAREKLALRAAHKALDIPQDDMHINANKTTTINHNGGGMGKFFGGALVAAVLAGWIGLSGYLLTRGGDAPAAPTQQAWDAVYEKQNPDGTWSEFKRERLKP
jgi:hypothetical protein